MSTRQKIEMAIAQLPPQEFRELARWIDARRAEAWDRQIEEDVASGKMDRFFAELEKENSGQPNVPLDEFLDQSELPKTLGSTAARSAGSGDKKLPVVEEQPESSLPAL